MAKLENKYGYDILPEEVEEDYIVWFWQLIYSRVPLLSCHADVVELVDTRDLKSLTRQGVPVQVRSSVPFVMKKDTKDDIKAGALGGVIVALIAWSLLGCTTTHNYEHFKDVAYQYYVIDESSDEPDAYFETKDEAEDYKRYFEKHHNYKIVSMK